MSGIEFTSNSSYQRRGSLHDRRTDGHNDRPDDRPDDRAPAAANPTRGAAQPDSAAHLLRLCLDLQLDSLLLALGSSATDDSSIPWRRWISEDVDLASMMASDAMAGRVSLPSVLGNELSRAVPAVAIANLTARYTSMRDLLADVLDDATARQGRMELLVEALHRCQARLVELRMYRLAEMPPQGLPLDGGASSAAPAAAKEKQYLPGELLG